MAAPDVTQRRHRVFWPGRGFCWVCLQLPPFSNSTHFFEKTKYMNIYVGNLAYSMTDSDLRSAFEAYGAVDSASVLVDKFSGQSKGFGFVEMASNSEADAAIKGLNDSAINGRNIKVNQAKPRAERSGGGGRHF